MDKAIFLAIVPLLFAAAPATPPATTPSATTVAATQPLSPVAAGAQPVRLAGGMAFTEGSTSDKDGNVYFIDQPNDRIMRYTFDPNSDDPTKGKLEIFMKPSGYSNGMSFDKDGNLIACADEKNELWKIAAPFPPLPASATVSTTQPATTQPVGLKPSDFKITVLFKDRDGKLLNAPNDIWIIPQGAPNAGCYYFTDPLYSRSWWGAVRPANDRVSQQPGRYVYLYNPEKKTFLPVITDFRQPNGIIGKPDGKTLYVSDIDSNQTWSYTINEDGTLKDKKLFCNTGSDGMTIDNEGNVYTTSGRNGLIIWDKTGKQVAQFRLNCANVCFGGKDKNILFICANREIYALKMRTKGVDPQ